MNLQTHTTSEWIVLFLAIFIIVMGVVNTILFFSRPGKNVFYFITGKEVGFFGRLLFGVVFLGIYLIAICMACVRMLFQIVAFHGAKLVKAVISRLKRIKIVKRR